MFIQAEFHARHIEQCSNFCFKDPENINLDIYGTLQKEKWSRNLVGLYSRNYEGANYDKDSFKGPHKGLFPFLSVLSCPITIMRVTERI